MELQLAIDLLNKEDAAELAKKVTDYVDIVEIGTPIVINEGLPAVQHLKDNVEDRDVKVLADLKNYGRCGLRSESSHQIWCGRRNDFRCCRR